MWLYLAALWGLYFLRRWYRERQIMENLAEKYIFITGCDSGFGNHLARQLDARGMQVLAACLTQKGAEELQKAATGRLKTTILDVTSTESVDAAMEWVKGCVGDKGLWGLVNNAGVAVPTGPIEWLTKEDFAKVVNVNLFGMVDVTLHMVPLVRKARGRVVNVSSIGGRLVTGCIGNYCASKFAVEAFSDSLRRDLHPFGVHLSIMEPGSFATPASSPIVKSYREKWAQAPADIRESYGQEYLEAYCRIWQQTGKRANNNLRLVSDCIEHALTSRYPRTRYSAGWDAKCIFLPLSYLPAKVADYVIYHHSPKPAQAV